jgi:cytochrome c-type protein NapB
MYSGAARALDYAAMPGGPNRKRTLAVYYARRAYPGAPPVVPHAVEDREASGRACLACHGDGGWAPRFLAYAPVTPHPELTSCRQCHVPADKPGLFRATGWQTVAPPALRGAAMPGSPPPIPHGVEMRERCQACHAGPGAVDELRTTHPERVGCRQCHALGAPSEAFARPVDGGGR